MSMQGTRPQWYLIMPNLPPALSGPIFPSGWRAATETRLNGIACTGSSPWSDCSRFLTVDEEQPKKSVSEKSHVYGPSPNSDCLSSSPMGNEQARRAAPEKANVSGPSLCPAFLSCLILDVQPKKSAAVKANVTEPFPNHESSPPRDDDEPREPVLSKPSRTDHTRTIATRKDHEQAKKSASAKLYIPGPFWTHAAPVLPQQLTSSRRNQPQWYQI